LRSCSRARRVLDIFLVAASAAPHSQPCSLVPSRGSRPVNTRGRRNEPVSIEPPIKGVKRHRGCFSPRGGAKVPCTGYPVPVSPALVQATGPVRDAPGGSATTRIRIDPGSLLAASAPAPAFSPGESICVGGVCLTLVDDPAEEGGLL